MRHFKSAKKEGEDYAMLIPKHKRSKDGPAPVGLNPENYELIVTYINEIRPQVEANDEKCIFVKQNGRGIEPGTIGKHLSAVWEKSLVLKQTDIRKYMPQKHTNLWRR